MTYLKFDIAVIHSSNTFYYYVLNKNSYDWIFHWVRKLLNIELSNKAKLYLKNNLSHVSLLRARYFLLKLIHHRLTCIVFMIRLYL